MIDFIKCMKKTEHFIHKYTKCKQLHIRALKHFCFIFELKAINVVGITNN